MAIRVARSSCDRAFEIFMSGDPQNAFDLAVYRFALEYLEGLEKGRLKKRERVTIFDLDLRLKEVQSLATQAKEARFEFVRARDTFWSTFSFRDRCAYEGKLEKYEKAIALYQEALDLYRSNILDIGQTLIDPKAFRINRLYDRQYISYQAAVIVSIGILETYESETSSSLESSLPKL
jgi:hypothetical protein